MNNNQNITQAAGHAREPGAGISRRDALRLGLAGTLAAALPGRAAGAQPAAAAAVAGTPAARAVIQIWLWGGFSHVDTFDPKPGAGAQNDYSGPFANPIASATDGLLLCEKLPELAKRSAKYSVLRSLTHGINAHEIASYVVQSGWPSGQDVHPCIGAVVSKLRGYDAGYSSRIPPYVVLCEAQGRFSESGFLGRAYKPFATGGNPAAPRFAVDGIVAEGIEPGRQASRRDLLAKLDTLGRALAGHDRLATFERSLDMAYEMILGDAGQVFDPAREDDAMRERYGRNTFGQSCLVARRLVESGVPYVTINFKGWDTHKRHFEEMNKKLPELDRGLSTLLDDLEERGLLASTVVWCGCEFGRTPKILWEPPWNGGRGHFGACFSALVAGGGFKGGRVLGATDKTGESVIERPVSPEEFLAAIYLRMGIDPASALPNNVGKETTILPSIAGLEHPPLHELA